MLTAACSPAASSARIIRRPSCRCRQTGATRSRPSPPRPPQLSRWWQRLRDPQLNTLVDEAVAGNLDVATAKAKIREARASYRQSVGTLLPSVDGSGSATRNKSAVATVRLERRSYSEYQAGFDASWELDLFGANRRGVEAARYGLDASRGGAALDASDPGRRRRILPMPRRAATRPASRSPRRSAASQRQTADTHPHHGAGGYGNALPMSPRRWGRQAAPKPLFRRWKQAMPKPCIVSPC